MRQRWAYYNEIDPFCIEWLRNLIKGGALPDGCIDHRSIELVQPEDVRDFHEVHLFAGIGLWARSLRIGRFPEDVPVWTGSCPCQPYSVAGSARAESDHRALWPEMRRLLAEHVPPIIFGEQVTGKLGLEWLTGVRADLEALGYAFGSADIPAAGAGAPQARQRLYWGASRLAHSHEARLQVLRSNVLLRAGWRQEGRATQSSGGNALPTWDAQAYQWSDENFRRLEPGLRIVADAGDAKGRVGRIQAYGNAICPAVAARFIYSFTMACETS